MPRESYETWEDYRRRMLQETARFIEYGLKHPEMSIEIPSKPASQPPFPGKVGQWFWGVVLSDRISPSLEHWRDVLRHRPKGGFFRPK